MEYRILWITLCIAFKSCIYVRAQCTLPTALRGNWISADKGELAINETDISGYGHRVPAPNLPSELTFNCREKRDDRYWLHAHETDTIFGLMAQFHTCLEIHRESDEIFFYYIGKSYDLFAQENIYVELSNAPAPAFSNVCDIQPPYATQTFIALIKEDLVNSKSSNTSCPSDLQAIFSNITIEDSAGSQICANSSLNVCTNRAILNFTIDADCTKTTFSAANQFRCLFNRDTSNGTYVSLLNVDANVDNTNTFQFVCFAYKRETTTLFSSETPRYCDANASPYTRPTNGRKYIYASIQESCIITVPTTTAAPFVANLDYLFILVGVFVLLLLIHCIVLIRLLCRDYGRKCLKKFKLPKKKIKDIDVRKGEKVKPLKFKTVATIATKMRVPSFRPKRPIDQIYPLFDPTWDPMTLTEITVPKITTIYNDSIEDFMRGRLPRTISRSSLHSFDSIPWVSDVTDTSSVSSY